MKSKFQTRKEDSQNKIVNYGGTYELGRGFDLNPTSAQFDNSFK